MTTLVLLPAFPLDSSMYDVLRDKIDASVLTPDLPGFGGAPLPPDEPDLERYVDAVIDRLDWSYMEDCVIGGTSMGGYVALALARRHPERVRGLVLIDSKASADTPEAVAGRHDLADRIGREQSSAPLMEGLVPKLLGETTKSRNDELVALVRTSVEAVDPVSAAWAQRAMAGRADTFDVLRALDRPVLVIVGAEDVVTPVADGQAMADASSNSELRVIDAAGHLSPLEATGQVAEAINDFMRENKL